MRHNHRYMNLELEADSITCPYCGQQVEVVISQSPFYAEGGGQMGDRGSIGGPNGVVSVEDWNN